MEIHYGDYVFTNAEIQNLPNIYRTVSALCDTLEYDTFTFAVKSDAVGELKLFTKYMEWLHTSDDKGIVIDSGDFADFTYAAPVEIYESETLKAVFYVEDVVPAFIRDMSDEIFRVTAVSAIGLLSHRPHAGGIYNAATAASVIAEIMGDIVYTVDADVAGVLLYGWLPYVKDARKNLSQVLFALGASALKTASGALRITYNQQDAARIIPPDRIFLSSTAARRERASRVIVTEHAFFQSLYAAEEVVYDNSAEALASETMQIFSEPLYDYRGDGLTIIASGANWARVSGIGRLYAKKYIHSQRELQQVIDATAEDNPVTVSDKTLVSTANVHSILERYANYYSSAKVRTFDFVVQGENAGDLVQITDRKGTNITGYLKSIDESASSFWRGAAEIVTDWQPQTAGADFDSFVIVKKSDLVNGSWNVPAAMQGKRARVVLFSGAQGGQGGWYGETKGFNYGTQPRLFTSWDDTSWVVYGGLGAVQAGGNGGKGGKGGASAARIINIDIEALDSSYAVTFGDGGSGGAGGTSVRDVENGIFFPALTPPEDGQRGGDSTFGLYSTEFGGAFEGTYINIVTGEVIAQAGESGTDGGDGGDGGASLEYAEFDTRSEANAFAYADGNAENGDSVGSNVGGAGSAGMTTNAIYDNTDGSFNRHNVTLPLKVLMLSPAGGCGGGGAALGGNGSAAKNGLSVSYSIRTVDGEGHTLYTTTYNSFSFYQVWWGEDWATYNIQDLSIGGDGGSATVIPDQAVYRGGKGGNGGGGGGGAAQPIGRYSFNYAGTNGAAFLGETLSGCGGNGGKGGKGSDGFLVCYFKAS